MTPDEMIEVIAAYRDGKRIECREVRTFLWGRTFKQGTTPCWNFGAYEYRVKPGPVEFWINVYAGREFRSGCAYSDRRKAEAMCGAGGRTILVREVTGE